MDAKASLRRFRWVALLSLLGFVWLFAILAQSGQATRKEALTYVPYYQSGVSDPFILQGPRLVPLESSPSPAGTYVHTLKLQTSDAASWCEVDRVGLEIVGLGAHETIRSARLIVQTRQQRDDIAVFETAQPDQFASGPILLLERSGTCEAKPSPNGPGVAKLEIFTLNPFAFSLRVQPSRNEPLSHLLWLPIQGEVGDEVYGNVLGWIEPIDKGLTPFSKAQLLAYMWGLGTQGSKFVYALCGVAALLWLTGWLIIASGCNASGSLREAPGAGLLFLAVLLVYSFISPPFHGPDEVNHFLAYADQQSDSTFQRRVLDLANTGHLERIKRRKSEKFTSIDTLVSRNDRWAKYVGATPRSRSPLCNVVWAGVARTFNDANVARILITIRITNALFVASCLTLGLVAIARLFDRPKLLLWFALPLLLVPSIAYWATAVSNYPFLIGGYAIQTVVLGALWIFVGNPATGTRQFVPIGLLLGLGLGVALCSADNAIASLAFWALIVPAFLAVRSPGRPAAAFFKESGVFIGSMGASTLALCAAVAAGSGLQRFLPEGISSTVMSITPVGTSVLAAEFGFILTYLLGITAATSVLFLGIRHLGPLIPALGHRGRRIALATATIVVLVFLVGQFRIPEIALSKGGETTALKYSLSVVLAFADGLLPGPVDPMVSDSFWRKLGWLETELPKVIRQFLRIAMGVGIILLVATSLFYSSTRACKVFCVANILALIACLATIGFVYYVVLFNVNSRYIMVAYLFAAVMALEGFRRMFSPAGSVSPGHTTLLCTCLLAISLQCLAWSAIINRYF